MRTYSIQLDIHQIIFDKRINTHFLRHNLFLLKLNKYDVNMSEVRCQICNINHTKYEYINTTKRKFTECVCDGSLCNICFEIHTIISINDAPMKKLKSVDNINHYVQGRRL